MLKWYAMRTLLKVYSNLKPAFLHALEPPSRLENYLHYLVVEQVFKKILPKFNKLYKILKFVVPAQRVNILYLFVFTKVVNLRI